MGVIVRPGAIGSRISGKGASEAGCADGVLFTSGVALCSCGRADAASPFPAPEIQYNYNQRSSGNLHLAFLPIS